MCVVKQKDSKSHRQQSSSGANNASQSSLDNKDSSARLLPNSSQGSIMPTAPPLSEADMVMFRQLSNQSCTGNTCAYFRLDSETPSQGMAADSSDVALASGAGNVCPNCSAPPPTYDESREHQLLSWGAFIAAKPQRLSSVCAFHKLTFQLTGMCSVRTFLLQ